MQAKAQRKMTAREKMAHTELTAAQREADTASGAEQSEGGNDPLMVFRF